jgi:hypothetical protein
MQVKPTITCRPVAQTNTRLFMDALHALRTNHVCNSQLITLRISRCDVLEHGSNHPRTNISSRNAQFCDITPIKSHVRFPSRQPQLTGDTFVLCALTAQRDPTLSLSHSHPEKRPA